MNVIVPKLEYFISVGMERETRKTVGTSTYDSSYTKPKMLKHDEQYSIKSRTGNAPTQDKKRYDRVEMAIYSKEHAKKKVARHS